MSTHPASTKDHEVTYLTGGRVGENHTAQCSCGKTFESTHNSRLRRAIAMHINKVSADAEKVR